MLLIVVLKYFALRSHVWRLAGLMSFILMYGRVWGRKLMLTGGVEYLPDIR
jgi:hypothetical protein